MNQKLANLETMSAPKAILSNAVPAMLAMLMVLVYNIADLFFIGQTHDPLQVAAVSMCTPVFLIFMSLGNVFGIGGASLSSRSLGQGDTDRVKKISSFCFWGCVVMGALLSLVLFLGMGSVATTLGASPDIFDMVVSYLSILCLSGPCILISSCYSALVRAQGHARRAMVGMMVGNLVNVILDPIFILVLDFGVPGAAIATVIGYICSAIYYLIIIFRRDTMLSIQLQDFTVKEGILKNVLLIGIPASMSTLLMSLSQIIVNGQMATYGDLAVAGIGVAMKVTMITSMLCLGIGMGVQPLLGYTIGAQDEKKYNEIFKCALLFALAVGATLTAFCHLALGHIVGVFVTDQAAFEYGYAFSRILITTSFLFGILFVLINALQAAGAATASLLVNLSRQGIIYIPLVFILGHTVGIYGLVMAQPIADVLAITTATILYKRTRKTMFLKPT